MVLSDRIRVHLIGRSADQRLAILAPRRLSIQ